MRWKMCLLILLVAGMGVLPQSLTAGQSDSLWPLPADLAFEAIGNDDHGEKNSLLLLDHITEEFIVLYQNTDGRQVRPVSWSPQGDRLAFYKHVIDSDDEVCVVSIDNGHVLCMADKFIVHQDVHYDITWSEDGRSIYFISQDGDMLRLVEADVNSGETLHVAYEMTYDREEWGQTPPSIIWTPDLRFVAVGVTANHRPEGVLIDLETNESLDMGQVFQPYLEESVELEQPGGSYVCPEFSPSGRYLVGLIPTVPNPVEGPDRRMIIFNTAGNVVKVIDQEGFRPFCPTWSADESHLYIPHETLDPYERVFSIYSFANNELTDRIHSLDVGTEISLSPDETHIAFWGYYSVFEYGVYILYPDDTIRVACGPFAGCHHPVWRPIQS